MRYPVEIRQLVLPNLNRLDRCVSCHVGLEDPRLQNEEQPLKTHPGNYLETHNIQEIGCTVCHDGQGRALTGHDAHAIGLKDWEKPLLTAPFIEANCMRCHDVPALPGLETLKKGHDLFFSRGCLGCHKLEGKGGRLGPDLTDIADASARVKHAVAIDPHDLLTRFQANPNVAYIYESIATPATQPEVTAMPDFNFAGDELIALTVFLKGLSARSVPASYLARRQEGHQPEGAKGRALYAKYCIACHGADGKGGVKNINYAKKTVPALNTMAEKMFIEDATDAKYVADLLKSGVAIENMAPPLDIENRARVLAQYRAVKDVIKKGNPAAKADPKGPAPLIHMPQWFGQLGDNDIDGIIAYLLGLQPWEDSAPAPRNDQTIPD
ncbi:MAG: cytochrome c [Lentisphaerae bacterium]|nr:cytochrome c [Lentisphaerota bacterium]